MNAKQLLTHFDRLAEAPDAVPRLRRFILDLAVRGKLVEQDAGDEPAELLMRRCMIERDYAVSVGSARKEKPLPPVDGMPYTLPETWTWTRLGCTGRIFNGDSVSDTQKSELSRVASGYPFIATKDVGYGWQHLNYENGLRVPVDAGVLKVLRANSVLICAEGGSAGKKTGLTDRAICFGNKLFANEPWEGVDSSYLLALYQSSFFYQQFSLKMTGIIGGISRAEFVLLPTPMPPSAEQRRIVAKVDELMALCDQLEAAQQERERCRDRLAAASLQRLNQPAADVTPEAQREHARFHLNHLPRLITRPEQVKAMRQLLLNLAVRGRLVEQDAKESSASQLSSSIDANKLSLIKAGVIRKAAELPPLLSDDAVFEVPTGWIWERLGRVGYTQTGTTPPTSMPECFGGQTPFVTPSDLTALVTKYAGKGLTAIGVKHSRLIAKNSILMVCIGSTIGKVNTVDREVCCNQQINTLTPHVNGMTGYVAIALRSDYFQQLVIANAGMGTLPILSKGKWEQLPIPLPPLAEQHRIVAKVDELMALCDQLEAQLATTQTDSRRLLEAVLEAALM